MHNEAKKYVFDTFNNWFKDKKNTPISVLEIGSFNINGSVREVIQPFAKNYFGIDMQDGEGVDLVADGALYESPETYDVIVTAETFEHTPNWKNIINKSYINLKPNGIFIVTMAGEGRAPHSAIDTNPIRDWEYYENVDALKLKQALIQFRISDINVLGTDLRCFAIK